MFTEDKGAPVFKIQAASYDECKQKLYEQYGEDYTIVNRHPILKPGFLGLFQKEAMEVSYIVKPRSNPAVMHSPPVAPAATENGLETWRRNRDEILKAAGTSVTSTMQMASLDRKIDELNANINAKLEAIALAGNEKHPTIKKIEDLLERNEFTFKYITAISNRIRAELSLEQLEDFDFVEQTVVDWVGESISIAPVHAFRPPHVIVIVGPTGVGKTTTIAKMAANIILDAKKNSRQKPELRIVTIDRTRVGAMEQLVRYGELMGIQVDKAETADDVKTVYDDCRNSVDAILIDTSGYSPNDSAHIGQMRAILDVDNLHPDVYLAVSASTKARDLDLIIQNYEPFAFESVIVTKCDETKQYGNVLSILDDKHKSISYVTDGQRVPHNIRHADKIDFLTRLNDFKIDRVHIDDKFGAK